MHTFNPHTKAESAKVNENFTDLSTGEGDVDSNKLALTRAELFQSHVSSGLIWTIVSGLNGTMTAGVAYITDPTPLMLRLSVASITSRTFTASKDTYCDLGYDGVVDYNEVANGATAPTLASNHIRLAKVVTNGSAITSIGQEVSTNLDTDLMYPNSPDTKMVGVFSQSGDFVGAGGWRIVPIDMIYHNSGGFRLNSNGIQVKFKGLYRISANFSTQDGDATGFMISAFSKSNSAGNISNAGVDICSQRMCFTANGNPRGGSHTGLIKLNANDVVYWHTYSSSSVNYRWKGGGNSLDFSSMMIELVKKLP